MATVNELSRKNRKPPVLPGASMLAPMDASEPVHEQQTTPTKNGKAKGNGKDGKTQKGKGIGSGKDGQEGKGKGKVT